MNSAHVVLPPSISIGLLILRVVLGLYMVAHGAQKLFGWFGGHGLTRTGEFIAQLGFPRAPMFAFTAAGTEFVSGLLVTLGLLGPCGPALMISVMVVAIRSVHWKNGFFATNNGVELPLLFATGAAALGLIGFGAYSLDALLGLDYLSQPRFAWSALAIGLVGGLANLAISNRTSPRRPQ